MAPPSGKRKREDNDDGVEEEEELAQTTDRAVVAPRSSKKSKLEEAKRRAKEWGLQDKKKLEAAKVKRHSLEHAEAQPMSPSTAVTTKSTKTPPRKPRVSTSKKSSTTPASTKATSAKTASSPNVPEVKPATSVLATTTTNNNNSADSTPIISATPANTPIPSLSSQSMPMATNPHYVTGTLAVNPEYMAQYMMTHQPPGAALFPPPAYSAPTAYMPTNAAPLLPGFYPYNNVMMQQQQQQMATQQRSSGRVSSKLASPVTSAIPQKSAGKTVSTRKKAPPSTTTTATRRPDSPDSDEELIPPPPTLQMQISQQVLANVSASLKNQPAPHTEPPPEAYITSSYPNAAGDDDDDDHSESYEHDDQPIIVDEVEDFPMETTSAIMKHHSTTFMPWFVVVLAVALSISLLAANNNNTASSPSPTTITEAHIESLLDLPCYQDSQPQYQMIGDGDEMQTILIQPCENRDTTLPCPSLGFCQNGKLLHCTHESFEVNADGNTCELTPATRHETVALWMAALEERTIADLCVAGGSHADLPLFEYTKMQLLYPSTLAIHPLDKTVMQTAFATHEELGRWFIGLPDDHTIILPLRCRMAHFMSKILKTLLAWMGMLCWNTVTLCTRIMWSMMSTYPLLSLMGLLIVLVVRQVQSFQNYRHHLVKDIARMRDMAFDKLQDQYDTSHAVLHIRDEIVATLTAEPIVLVNSRIGGLQHQRQRQYWITAVWPQVIPYIQQDNRIKKTQRVEVGGKRRDYWQWVAAPRSSKKQVSIVTKSAQEEAADKKRTPPPPTTTTTTFHKKSQ